MSLHRLFFKIIFFYLTGTTLVHSEVDLTKAGENTYVFKFLVAPKTYLQKIKMSEVNPANVYRGHAVQLSFGLLRENNEYFIYYEELDLRRKQDTLIDDKKDKNLGVGFYHYWHPSFFLGPSLLLHNASIVSSNGTNTGHNLIIDVGGEKELVKTIYWSFKISYIAYSRLDSGNKIDGQAFYMGLKWIL